MGDEMAQDRIILSRISEVRDPRCLLPVASSLWLKPPTRSTGASTGLKGSCTWVMCYVFVLF
jgi:hypothetical protein